MGTVTQCVSLLLLVFGHALAVNEDASPSLYCFVRPTQSTSFDPSPLSNVSCTHFVFGPVPINNPRGKPEFTTWDLLHGGRDGNIRQFLRLRAKHPKAKFLLGVQRKTSFRDPIDAQNVAKGAKLASKERRFDGLFVTFEGSHLQQHTATIFIKELSTNVTTLPTVGITAQRVWQRDAVERIRDILSYSSHIYLDMSRLPAHEDPYHITHVDPLMPNGTIYFEDTIKGTVDRLAEEGIMPDNIIVGFTAGGWMFKVPNVMTISHGQFATAPGQRMTYQEACKSRGTVLFDERSLNEVILYRQTWISTNLPTHEALGKKIEWVLAENFAGVGISSMQDDDPTGLCGTDSLPAHNLAAQIVRGSLPSSRAKCTRFCHVDSALLDETFPFESLRPELCSHIVLNYFDIDFKDVLTVSKDSQLALLRITHWRNKITEFAPKLVLSMGSRQKTGAWSFLLSNDLKRKELAEELVKAANAQKANGIGIFWVREPMSNEFDKNNLNSFIEELKSIDENKMQIVVAVTAENSYSKLYDIDFLNKTVDFVELQSHMLHSNMLPYTGHQSPLRATTSMQKQNMNLVDLAKTWTDAGMTRSRMIVSMSASAMTMTTMGEQKSVDSAFGQLAFVNALRSDKQDIKTQQEICESIKMGSSTPEWVQGAEVPYLMRKGQMVVYENPKSAHIKAVWASMEGFGVSIHDVTADDPNAVCDNSTAFPILSQVTRAQVCPSCIKPHDFRKCNHNFTVSCSFDLKKSHPVFKTNIVPFERCTEIVVEQAKLNATGHIAYHDQYQEDVVRNLTSMRAKIGKCGMILSLKCGSSEKLFTNMLLDNMTMLIDNIVTSLDQQNFTGVLIDCESVVRRGNNLQYNSFLRKLNARMAERKAENGCARTVSLRFSPHTSSLTSLYQISQLNKLHHISLSTIDKQNIDADIFANKTAKHVSVESMLGMWLRSGVKPAKILLELSPMASRINGEKTDVLTQGQVCETAGNRAHFEMNFESMTAGYRHETGLISMPNIDTFRYKIGYARREHLGGVSLRNVNGDDYTGICGRGSFPILKSFYSSEKCV